jgi:hypothetical protein
MCWLTCIVINAHAQASLTAEELGSPTDNPAKMLGLSPFEGMEAVQEQKTPDLSPTLSADLPATVLSLTPSPSGSLAPAATPDPVLDLLGHRPTDNSRKSLGLLDIEEHIAKELYEQSPTLANKSVLLQVYEKIALALCFPDVSELLSGTRPELGSDCNAVLNEIEKLHPSNSSLICARQGVDSVECAQAFQQQSVRKANSSDFTLYSSISSSKDPADSPEGQKRFSSLQNVLLQTYEQYKAEASITNLKKLELASFPLLKLICSNQMLELSEVAPEQESKTNSDSISSLAESIKSFEKSLDGPEPAEVTIEKKVAELPKELFKKRILSERCFDTIADLSNLDQRLPSPICFRDSFISPSCISALRRFRNFKDQIPVNQPSPTPKDSLSSF